jgi:uncharacterized metal-binding protein
VARPVLFACQGCPEFGDLAHDVASVLAARGFAQPARLDDAADRPQAPVYTIEGCAKRCAGRSLGAHGVRAQRQFILAAPGESAEKIAERIMEGWRV